MCHFVLLIGLCFIIASIEVLNEQINGGGGGGGGGGDDDDDDDDDDDTTLLVPEHTDTELEVSK